MLKRESVCIICKEVHCVLHALYVCMYLEVRIVSNFYDGIKTEQHKKRKKKDCFSSLGNYQGSLTALYQSKKQLQQQREEDLNQEAWKLHVLYQESQPVLMAKLNESTLNLNRKYDLVKKIAERSGEAKNPVDMLSVTQLNDGNNKSIPNSTAGYMKLSVASVEVYLEWKYI